MWNPFWFFGLRGFGPHFSPHNSTTRTLSGSLLGSRGSLLQWLSRAVDDFPLWNRPEVPVVGLPVNLPTWPPRGVLRLSLYLIPRSNASYASCHGFRGHMPQESPPIPTHGNEPHLENIEAKLDSALLTILAQLVIPLLRFFSWRVSRNLHNYTASKAAVADDAILSESPDAIRAVFLTKTTPRQLAQFLSSLILRCNALQLCSRVCGECPRGVLSPMESNLVKPSTRYATWYLFTSLDSL